MACDRARKVAIAASGRRGARRAVPYRDPRSPLHRPRSHQDWQSAPTFSVPRLTTTDPAWPRRRRAVWILGAVLRNAAFVTCLKTPACSTITDVRHLRQLLEGTPVGMLTTQTRGGEATAGRCSCTMSMRWVAVANHRSPFAEGLRIESKTPA